jgi:thymidylate synthase (FAD)
MRFYQPQEFRTQHKSNRQASNENELIDPDIVSLDNIKTKASEAVLVHHIHSLALFEKLLDAGVCREQARGVLPQNLYTEYYGTVNLHNLMHFIRLRTHEGAQWEIQKVAEALNTIALTLWPVSVAAFANRT